MSQTDYSKKPPVTADERTAAREKRAEMYARIAVGLTFGGIIIIALCILAYWLTLSSQGLSADSTHWGTFGDFVGGIAGTFVALGALIALALSLNLQARELSDTKEELRQTREVSETQRFDSVFFNLIRVLNEARQGDKRPNHHKPADLGYEAMDLLTASEDTTLLARHKINELYDDNESILAPYVKTYATACELLAKLPAEHAELSTYIGVLHSMASARESLLLQILAYFEVPDARLKLATRAHVPLPSATHTWITEWAEVKQRLESNAGNNVSATATG